MLQVQTDEKLVARTMAGDRSAFRLLVERHYAQVFRLCRSILRHTDDAEDATQEVFLRVHQSLAQYAGRGPFAAWLRRLTVNHCLNRVQRVASQAAARSLSIDLLAETLPAAPESDPAEAFERADNSARIRSELQYLPAAQRAALGLRLLEGRSYEEIADIMGAPVNSVRSWLHRGRERLRVALKEVVEC